MGDDLRPAELDAAFPRPGITESAESLQCFQHPLDHLKGPSQRWQIAAEKLGMPLSFAGRCHRGLEPGGWGHGKKMMELLISVGLKPKHRLFDVGCGALRFGVQAISYLKKGHYYGLDP